MAGLVSLYALNLLLSTVDGTSRAVLRVFDKFAWLSAQSVLVSAFKFGLIGVIFFMKYSLKQVLIAYLISEGIGSAILVVLSLKVIKTRMKGAYREARLSLLRGRLREMASMLWHTNLTTFLKLAGVRIDEILLGYFQAPTQVGYYKLAKTVIAILGKVGHPIYAAVYPEIIKLWAAGRQEEFKAFLKKVTVLTGAAILPLALGIFAFAPWIIKLIAGEEFIASALAARIMIWGQVARLLPLWVRPTEIGMGKAYISNLGLMLSAVLWPLGSLVLMPLWGVNGAAVLYLFNTLVRISFVMFLIRRNMQRSERSVLIGQGYD